ncbi:PspC domain-containing protein [Microbacterium sp. NPDC077663]|uniref:PspC domain-containing protein n=1 Tax=Microbacterium sp. NPDC077663 TaxID=3364189 RepID=UPI0037CC1FCF
MDPQPALAPPADPPPARPSRGERFFGWTSSLGVIRADGWFGGVAAGVAARWGVDPLIVRGILVVLGVVGIPVALLYGVAWAVLPDADGRIPAQEAGERRFHPAQIGAALFVAAAFVPSPIALLLGLPALSVLTRVFSDGLTAVAVTIAVVAILFAVVVVLLPRRRDVAPVIAAEPEDGDPADHIDRPEEPATPGRDADDDELAQWRAQHAAWKAQDQAWRREQQDAARIAREQVRRERQERAAAFATEAAERRRHRQATAPRAPFAFAALAVGAAVTAGTIVALTARAADPIAAGLFVAALVLAGAMTVAGALRRRSGFLAFVTAVTLVAGVAATAMTVGRELHFGSWGISNIDGSATSGTTFVQPWGDLSVVLADTERYGTTTVEKRSGSTTVGVDEGVRVDVDIVTENAGVYISTPTDGGLTPAEVGGVVETTLPDGRTRYSMSLGETTSPTTTHTLVIEQDSGYIDLFLQNDITPEGPSS